jgi:hypothetical protein
MYLTNQVEWLKVYEFTVPKSILNETYALEVGKFHVMVACVASPHLI